MREDFYIPLKPVVKDRKARFDSLTNYVRARNGWITSVPGAPDVTVEFHCRELPLLCSFGREAMPEVYFHDDDSCLDRTYDLVIASSSLQYTEDWEPLLARLAGAASGLVYLAGLPVVTTANVGGRDEFLDPRAARWVDDDPREVAAAVHELTTDPVDPLVSGASAPVEPVLVSEPPMPVAPPLVPGPLVAPPVPPSEVAPPVVAPPVVRPVVPPLVPPVRVWACTAVDSIKRPKTARPPKPRIVRNLRMIVS